jgi:hypothetical protein
MKGTGRESSKKKAKKFSGLMRNAANTPLQPLHRVCHSLRAVRLVLDHLQGSEPINIALTEC